MDCTYELVVKTGAITKHLMQCQDQVATTKDLCDHFDVPESTLRKAMGRLKRVNRVDEFFPNMWHLE